MNGNAAQMEATRQVARGARHFIYVPARESAESICSVLEREGWETAIDEDGDFVLVTASCLRVMAEPLATEARTHLTMLAQQHGGSYDGSD